ncbi:MAG: hypothetical protein GY861_20510, partial [bacterium]|nr:hypothetical protein [bacterium]
AMVNYTSSSPTITRSVFSGNSSNKYGGGIRNYSSSPSITNSLFSGNTATTIGGGMYNESSSNPSLMNVTLSGNYAGTDGGAIYNNSSDPIIKNSIIWNNKETSSTTTTSASIKNSSSSATPNISYSLIANSNGSGGSWDSQYSIDGGNNVDGDPDFVTPLTPTTNASTAGDFNLEDEDASNSPAFGSGTSSGAPSDDIEGNSRPNPAQASPDMGAYEFAEPDTYSPTAIITYSSTGPYKEDDSITITATFNEDMKDSPVPQIAIDAPGTNDVSATNMTKSSTTVYTYAYTVGDSDGSATITMSTGVDLSDNVITSSPTSGGTFTLDNTAPTAGLTYTVSGSPVTRVKNTQTLLITATFNEDMADSPVPKIALTNIAGSVSSLSATDMTKVSATSYTYNYAVPVGDGTQLASLSIGTDDAGNVITSTPTSGTTFIVDNTASTVTDGNISIGGSSGDGGVYIVGDTVTATWNNTAGGDNNSNIDTVTVNFSEFGGGTAVSASDSSDTWTATYEIVAGSINSVADKNVFITVTDNATNATTTEDGTGATLDNQAPTAPVVTGTTPTNDDTPTWTWSAGGGGNGTYRYKLDNSDLTSGATATTSLNYTPSAQSETTHTLYVQERDTAGNWSSSDSFAILIDTTDPTASVAYTVSGVVTAVKSGQTLRITATFNEVMRDSPVPKVAISGANTQSATDMTKTDTTHYYYDHTVGSGDGTATIALSVGLDSAGNTITSAPTSGSTIIIDNTNPTVTDGNISISGASGIGGEYIIGDTVTATWNDTAGGDNNGDIDTVTVNFSEFGGGVAVSASNSSDTWTATYDIVAGSVNSVADKNIHVTATDNATNVTTTEDGTGATLDNQAPTSQNTVFSSSAEKNINEAVTIVSSGDATNNVWLAFTGITSFSAGSTMTTAGGTATSITSPATPGIYYMYVLDAAGNPSTKSTATLTVDIIGTAGVIYVSSDATNDDGAGTSWGTAKKYLQSALAIAGDGGEDDDEIWVKAGTYYPDEGSETDNGNDGNNVQSSKYEMKAGVAIYGGFAGTETATSQRTNFYGVGTTNETILSGDIEKDSNLDAQNSYQVVYSTGLDDTAVLDGFTVTM